ncbi:hypothetical protein ABTL52_20110, partial [Acinetobacter baumannii]
EHIVGRLQALSARAGVRKVLATATIAFGEAWEARRELLPYAGAVALRTIAGVRVESDRDPMRLELTARIEAAQSRGEIDAPLPAAML